MEIALWWFPPVNFKYKVAELIGTSLNPGSRAASSFLPLDQDPFQAEMLDAGKLLRLRKGLGQALLHVHRLGSPWLLHCPFLALPFPKACGGAGSVPQLPARRGKAAVLPGPGAVAGWGPRHGGTRAQGCLAAFTAPEANVVK